MNNSVRVFRNIVIAASPLAVLLSSAPSRALTWDFTISGITDAAPPNNTYLATGQIITDGASYDSSTVYNITNITGTFQYQGSTYTITGASTHGGATNKIKWQGTPSSAILTNYAGFAFDAAVPVLGNKGVNFYYNNNNSQYSAVDKNYSAYFGNLTIASQSLSPVSGPASVPGPLPMLGAAAAFNMSRRLRRRINRTA